MHCAKVIGSIPGGDQKGHMDTCFAHTRIMALVSNLKSDSDLDSIRNSCDVLTMLNYNIGQASLILVTPDSSSVDKNSEKKDQGSCTHHGTLRALTTLATPPKSCV